MFDEFVNRKPASPEAKVESAPKLPEQMIVPRVDKVDESDVIRVKRVETLADLATLPFDGAVSIDEGALMKIALDNPELVGVRLVVLSGVPGAVYSAAWDQATWGLERIAYDTVVNEIVTVERVDKMRSDQAGSRQKAEKRQQELTKERTRHFTGFQAVGAGAEDDPDAAA